MKMPNGILATIAMAMLVANGCATGATGAGELSRREIESILKDERIPSGAIVQQQRDGDFVSLFARVGFRGTEYGGCLADEYILELSRDKAGWIVESSNKFLKASYASCVSASEDDFFDAYGSYSPMMMQRALRDFSRLKTGGVPSTMISFSSNDLRQVLARVELKSTVSVTFVGETEVRFQFEDEQLFPARLGLNMTYSNGALEGVSLDSYESVEVVR